MKIMNCPLNGARNISEFAYGGEVRTMPEPNNSATGEWSDYIFNRDNSAGIVREWWCHTPTSFWFIAERDTVSDEIVRTYPAGEIFTQRINFANGAMSNE